MAAAHSCCRISGGIVLAALATAQPAAAQPFGIGDVVEAAPQKWELCTVTGVLSAGYRVNCAGEDYVVGPDWVREPRGIGASGADRAPAAGTATGGAPDRADPGPGGTIALGRYQCWGPSGYTAFDIVITGPDTYTDKAGAGGTYAYDPLSRRIDYASGPYRGQYSEHLAPGAIGLSAEPTDFFGIVCQIRFDAG